MSIGQDIRELGPLELHPGEDVVAGAIDDAGDARNSVSGEGFPERLDDRNAPGHGGFVVEVGLMLRSQGEEFWAVGREESLVGGDHRLAQFEGCTDHLACCCHSAHQFDHELDLGIMDHLAPVAGQHRGGYGESACSLRIAHGHADDVQSDSQPSGHEIAVALQRLPDATTHCAATHQTQVDLLHHRGAEGAPSCLPGTTGFFAWVVSDPFSLGSFTHGSATSNSLPEVRLFELQENQWVQIFPRTRLGAPGSRTVSAPA